jgi:SAM-dependent methyltransferase
MTTDKPNYRQRIFREYTSYSQNPKAPLDSGTIKRWAQGYDTYLKGWLPQRKDASILEVGCGSGRLLHFFKAREYTNITGVDISQEQVQLAKKIVEAVVQADILEFLENVDKTYNLIIGLDIIEHFQKDEVLRFLDACYKALEPHGRIILQTPNAQSPFGPAVFYGDFTHEICFTPNGLQRVLNLCGFHKVQVRETGPVVHGLASALRYVFWRMTRLGLKLWSLIETGNREDSVFTRTFLISAHKK